MANPRTNKTNPAPAGTAPAGTAPAGTADNASGTNTTGSTTTTKPPRVAPVITGVLAASQLPMPQRVVNRGSKTNYPFETLGSVGDSFGVKNKTALNIQSIVANQNRKLGAIKTGADGLPIAKRNPDGSVKYLEVEMKDANGAVIGKVPGNATNGAEIDFERFPQKKFFAMDVDAATDPQGASVRVWREA